MANGTQHIIYDLEIPVTVAWKETIQLKNDDDEGWSGDSALTAAFSLVLTDGVTTVDLSDHVTATAANTIAIIVPVAEWANFRDAPQVLKGWLTWTPSGKEPEPLAKIRRLQLEAVPA